MMWPVIFDQDGKTPRTADEPEQALGALSDRRLLDRYQAISMAIDADDDPAGRAARIDALAEEILRRRPEDSSFWTDRGMYAKWRADWPAAIRYNQQALDLLPAGERQGEAAAWNLGIAATAARDWVTARQAWAAFGIGLPEVDDPGEPVVTDFGPAPARLNAEPRFAGQEPMTVDGRTGAVEVVWGRRLCPTRIQIVNVPTPAVRRARTRSSRWPCPDRSGPPAGMLLRHSGQSFVGAAAS